MIKIGDKVRPSEIYFAIAEEERERFKNESLVVKKTDVFGNWPISCEYEDGRVGLFARDEIELLDSVSRETLKEKDENSSH